MRSALLLGVLFLKASPVAPRIVGGSSDAGDPAVVGVNLAFWPTCSGTLIGPTTVLTAGHCVFHIPFVSTHVVFGRSAWHPSRSIKVVAQRRHPLYSGEGKPYDLAVLELETAVTDVTPIRLSSRVPGVGELIRHVGYGTTGDVYPLGLGEKRSVSYAITRVTDTQLWSGGAGRQTCSGDSGGPGLMPNLTTGQEELVSTVSDGPSCHEIGWDSRVLGDWLAERSLQPLEKPHLKGSSESPPPNGPRPPRSCCDRTR